MENIFLKLEGVPGEAKADGHFDGEITVFSWQWGASNPVAVDTGKGTSSSGNASLSEITCQIPLDKSFPVLMEKCHLGSSITTAVIHCERKSGAEKIDYYKVSLGVVFITSISTGASSGSEPSVSVSFAYDTIKYEYWAETDTGDEAGVASTTWNVPKHTLT
jgi:type VI secretion system Hcp family effector